jgi:integrase
MALWKRGKRYWTYFSVNGVQWRRPLRAPGAALATTNWQEAARLEKEVIRAAVAGELAPRDPAVKLFAAVDDYLEAKKATANSERTVAFDRERLEIVKRHFGDVKLLTITRRSIERFQAKRRLEGASNRTINMDVGALRQVLKRFKQWRRLEDDVKMMTEAGGAPVGRALTPEEQTRLLEAAAGNAEWEHVYCAAVLAANTSMRGVEVKHVRRRDVDLEKVWDVESATGNRDWTERLECALSETSDCDRAVIRRAQNLEEHRGLRTHTE